MKKGNYKIEGGQLYQIVNVGNLTILDVKAGVGVNSKGYSGDVKNS